MTLRIKAFGDHILTSTFKSGFMSEDTREDPLELFWLLVMNPYYREANGFGDEVIWLVGQGIFFTVEIETTDKIMRFQSRYGNIYVYEEHVSFWINILNPDDAMFFKLVWGNG